ncbi:MULTISPECIES: ribonuclease HII [unclassified Cryobacterium]|uniref:ribonuclease HII n=1 Tax=unclassified Cryobacterium TaxID=2649013 RepID=UPI001069E59D|nr:MULTISPECIES: ribonuclease HII [unclassified Cryobacterium]MDY7528163.1 ribonuclease HII [Cryobacterium sp. 10C2]MEB0001956.1 ribonuclease HII [Cryobacterium sp. RTC2.1]MEB0200506.1 ribonuclease HII [Cryobacterium sp. 5I3]MEB0285494.1 ribonuclease HII [Cryobacterium sp. 10S3]MEB0289338.1 ribonuclease HII [Cryobacterium sp. 10C2]
MAVCDPTLEVELGLLAEGASCVIGCDEVGRGALAGPVGVGVAAIDGTHGTMPVGLRDSKMLSERRREALAPLAVAWVLHSAVGLASAKEVDEIGIIAALGLAGKRALAELFAAGVDVRGSVVLLDGNDDYLNKALATPLSVLTRIKADQDCASVSAASVIAKVHRDRLMIAADAVTPGYGWAGNKGYGSAEHMAAIGRLGPTGLHRKSWLTISA